MNNPSGMVFGLVLASCSTQVAAQQPQQQKPWVLFLDDESESRCDVVNADNAELVVLQGTGQMVIVSGTDVTLADTVVDALGFVTFEGDPAGVIDFALDGDGLRTLWWTSLTGQVVEVDGFTGEPDFTGNLPEDYRDVPCDACDFWDDAAVCPEPQPPTVNLCGTSIPLGAASAFVGLMGMRLRRLHFRS